MTDYLFMGFPYQCPHCKGFRKWESWKTLSTFLRVISIEYECGRRADIEIMSGKSFLTVKKQCPKKRP